MVCKDIGCPHPSQLGRFGIGVRELTDWFGFYLWENRTEEHDDGDRIALLESYKSRQAEKE